jgi:hypothetical protein
MKWRLHVPYGVAIIVLTIVAGLWYEKAVHGRARLRAVADSATDARRRLDATAATLLAHVRADSAEAANVQTAMHRKDAEIREIGVSAATAVSRLTAQLTARQQVLLDSITMLDSNKLALVAAQRDSALALLLRASADRDSLVRLVTTYQSQLNAAVARLQEAARTPFFDSKPVRLVLAVLAVKGATDFVQRR